MFFQNVGFYFFALIVWLVIVVLSFAKSSDLHNLVVLSWGFLFVSVVGLSFSQMDNLSKWSITVHTLPYKRSEIVCADYIFGVLSMVCVSVIYLLFMLLVKLCGMQYEWSDIFSLLLTSFGVGLIPLMMFSPIITLMNKQGIKAMISGAIGFICSIGLMFVDGIYENANDRMMFAVIFFSSCAALYALSWLLSLKIMKNKDIV